MKMVSVHEAKTKLSGILAAIESTGESYLVCRRGKPVARLVPHVKVNRLKPHPVMSRIKLNYDPTEPLTEEEWPEVSR